MLINNCSISILCAIVIFLQTSTSFSMDLTSHRTPNDVTFITSQQKDDLDRIHRNFSEGIMLLGMENKKAAEALLAGAYFYGKKHDLFNLVHPGQLNTVSKILYDINYEKGYLTTAAECALSNTKKGITYRHMAQKAHTEEKFDLEKEHYATAFNFFEQSYRTDPQAKKHYEDALWCGRGYEYNPSIIQNYYLSRLQDAVAIRHSYLDLQTYNLSKKITTQALTQLAKLAQEDPATQCTLAKIYLYGGECIPTDYNKALVLTKDALCNLAIEPIGKPLHGYNDLPAIIADLCKNSNLDIQRQALTLEKYWNVLSAIKKQDHLALKKYGELYYHDTTLDSLALQLLCSRVNLCIAQCLKDLTFHDETTDAQAFKQFCRSKNGELAAHILEWSLLDVSPEPEIKNLFHLMLGGYAYHCNKFDTAVHHFKQCNDLYPRALSIQMDTNESSRIEKIVSIVPLLRNSLDSRTNNKKDIAAQKIIAVLCGYNSSAPIEDTVSFCQVWVPHFAVSDSSEHPLQYIQVLMGLHDLRKKTDLSIEQKRLIDQFTAYFDFFSLLHADDQKGLDAFFSKKNGSIKGLPRKILQAIRGNKKNDLQKNLFESNDFNKTCKSDTLFQIIAKITENPQKFPTVKLTHAYYLLGGYFYLAEEYELARNCFLRCNQNDLYIQAKLFQIAPIENMLEILNRCIPLLTNAQENDKNAQAKKIITETILLQYKEYRDMLIHYKQYEQAYQFAHCLAQLDQLVPSQIICNVFSILETSIIGQPYHAYRKLLGTPDRLSTYIIIKNMADKKDPAACDCISFILYEHCKHSDLASYDKLALARECLNYLAYSIEHDNRTNGSQQMKQSAYAQLACEFGISEQSIPLLDEAIAYGNSHALYEKARLLSRKKPINTNDLPHVIKLLEQHATSNDDDTRRAQSLSTLGKHYHTFKDLEHQKKSFYCLRSAADLGNYNAGHLLALFYINGLENHQAPDAEQAFICLQRTIDLKKESSYEDALYLRASMYYIENQYARAHQDLMLLLSYPGYNQSQKLFAYWLMGLVEISLNENMNLSQELVSHLRIAYETAASHKLENTDSPFMKDFKLLHDEKTLNCIQKNIDYIIGNNKTDAPSLDFCTIMGAVLFEQCSAQPITDQHRQYAVKSLRYAAEHGHVEAPFSLFLTSEEEIPLEERIYYLARLCNDPNLALTVNDILINAYPTDVISQGLLIKYFYTKNAPDILDKYTSQLFESQKPIVIDPIGYSLFSYEKTEQAIKDCLNIPLIRQCVESFMKNPIKSTPQEHFITIWWASLLAYSLDEKLLLKGAEYLEKSREWFPLFQKEHIEKNLGYIYYKLGWQHYKIKNLSSAISYLKKGCLLESANCKNLFHKITSEQINLNATVKQAITASTQEINMIHELHTKLGSSKHVTDLICTETDIPENEIKLYGEVETLIKRISNIDYFITSGNPLMCFNYAFDNYQNTQNNSKVQQAIQKAIATSIDDNGMFIMKIVLEKLCTFIKSIIEKNNKQQMELVLKTIKQECIKRKVNIKAFEALYKDLYKINLAQNIVWKKIK